MAVFRKTGRLHFLNRALGSKLVFAWTTLPHGEQDLVLTVQKIRKNDF